MKSSNSMSAIFAKNVLVEKIIWTLMFKLCMKIRKTFIVIYVHTLLMFTGILETILNVSMKSSNNINAAYVTRALALKQILKDM
jgi:hypothetical protein